MPSVRNPNDTMGIPGNESARIEAIGDGPTAPEEDVEAEEEAQKALDMRPQQQFKECIERAKKNQLPLAPEMVAAIEPMDLMNQPGGSAALCDPIFWWHLEHIDVGQAVSAEKLHSKPMQRCNLGPTLPKERGVNLPYANDVMLVPCTISKPRWWTC